MIRAITRAVPDSFVHAVSQVPRTEAIDVPRAREQHEAYRAALAECGVVVTELAADEACPDGMFVEDCAGICDARALVTRPGAPSRRGEVEPIARVLHGFMDVVRMTEPALLDGGDVMVLADAIYVGRSSRTNAEGIAMLASTFGRRIVEVELPPGELHLKCVCSPLGDDMILLANGTVPAAVFSASVIRVPVPEAYAANAVALGRHVIAAAGFPRTNAALEGAGFVVHEVDSSEARKADGALTCQSIVFDV